MNILHVSDLPFGPPFVEPVAQALLEAAHQLEIDLIVASGDFTQRAKPEQFAAARAFLDKLPRAPLVVTPGNHDVPLWRVLERITDPYRWYKELIHPELDYVLRLDTAVVVSINTTSPLRHTVNGRVEPWQLEFVERGFAGTPPGVPRILVAHHHFAPAPDYERPNVIPGAKRAMDRFAQLNVDLILGGHLHRAYIGNSLDVYPGPDREQGIIIAQSGTTTSRRGRAREREKNSFNYIRVGEDRIRITHYMHFSELEGFAPISRHVFPRPGSHWLAEVRGEPDEGIALGPPPGTDRD